MSHVGGSASPVLQHPRQADVHHAFITQWYKQRYSGERLQELLQETFGDITFGDEREVAEPVAAGAAPLQAI